MTNIRSSYKYKQCDKLCRAIALLRAGDRCELCGETAWQRHHIFFGRWAAFWQLRLNHNFHFILCQREHNKEPYAPHVDNKKFLTLLENKLIVVDRPRLTIIQHQHKLRDAGKLSDIPVDLDIIHAALKAEYEKADSSYWMDQDSQVDMYGRL